MPRQSFPTTYAPILLALLSSAGFAVIGLLHDPIASFPRMIAGVGLATIAWLLVCVAVFGLRGVLGRFSLILGFAVAVMARALLLLPEVPLSDDLYRYLWDGHVANSDVNPYTFAPHSPDLDTLHNDVRGKVNHPEIPTIYPPAAQVYFRVLDGVGATSRGVRALAALLDLGVCGLLLVVARNAGRPSHEVLVYALCPLPVLEFAGGGHVDGLALLALVGALALFSRGPAFSGLLLGISALTKGIPLALAPLFGARASGRAKVTFAAGMAASALLLLPYADAGPAMFSGLRAYSRHWHFLDALYTPLVDLGLDPWMVRKGLATSLAVVAVLLAAFERSLLRGCGLYFLAFLVLSPTVHPWYGVALVPFLFSLPRALLSAGVVLVALLPASYVVSWTERSSGVWDDAGIRSALWGCVLAAGVAGVVVQRLKLRRRGEDHEPEASRRGENASL